MNIEKEKKEIIYWASLLNQKGFVSATSGNISKKITLNKILITSHESYLGHLEEKEILLVDLEGRILKGNLDLTIEKDLHLGIHKRFKEINVIIHTHPPFTTAFFHYFSLLDIFSFEARFYLGKVPVISQDTPTVTEIEPVLKSLENNNIIALKGHGVVSVGADFKKAFSLIELLEEQARVNLLMKSGRLSEEQESKTVTVDYSRRSARYKLLSKEHTERLVKLINNDREAQELGAKYDLTTTLAVKNQDTGEVICFYYEKGRIIKTDNSENVQFLIIGREEILKKVFNREMDPFVASTQGKVKIKGDMTKMSKWYPVFVRTFRLWEKAPVE